MTPDTIIKTTILSTGLKSGYVQTPMGGRPGSSDYQRPTLQELGIHQLQCIDNTTQLGWRNFWLTFGDQHIHPQSTIQLKNHLLTYNQKLLPHTELHTDIQWDFYRLGAAYPLHFSKIEIAPSFNTLLFGFQYRLKTPQKAATTRAYHHFTLQSGLQITIPLNTVINLKVSGFTTPAFLETLQVSNLSAIFEIKDSDLSVGLNWIKMNFEDDQALPNHLHLNTGVMISIASRSRSQDIEAKKDASRVTL